MRVDLNGQVALVTGGAQGIGRAIAESLVNNGARVASLDVDRETNERTARELSQTGGTCLALEGDVSDRKQMDRAIAEIEDRLGGLQILVNNAGINTLSDRVPIHRFSGGTGNGS